MPITNPRAFVTGIVMVFVCIVSAFLIGWQGGMLIDGFYNNTAGYIPSGVITQAKSTTAASALYTSLELPYIQIYFINIFYFLDAVLFLLGFWFMYQGMVVDQGIEVEAGRRFNRP